jgi:vanillate/3-O-methylgallate O-demethylase
MDRTSQRRKVTLAWNHEDVAKIFASVFDPSVVPYKFLELPVSNYSSANYDSILLDGKLVGYSMFSGYSSNERAMLSLSTIDHEIPVGTEVTLVWGEPDGGSAKASVERPHRQLEVRATVAPAPYTKEVREHYAEGWRTHQV